MAGARCTARDLRSRLGQRVCDGLRAAGTGSRTYSAENQTQTPVQTQALARSASLGASGPEYGFTATTRRRSFRLSAHLRVNNDSAFLHSIMSGSTQSVDEVLEGIATGYKDTVRSKNGTLLVDYGDKMDGFSPSYKHGTLSRLLVSASLNPRHRNNCT